MTTVLWSRRTIQWSERLLGSDHIDQTTKDDLAAAYKALNPAELKRQIIKVQDKLFKFHINKQDMIRKEEPLQDISSTFSVSQ